AVTAPAYDAYILILDAIERAGSTDPVALRDAIAATEGFEGAAGIITLDENGDAVKNAVIKQVKNGEFVYMDTIEPR
ncbi:MAG TPA: branched-chain amino acid ABC transporter substrate-binding protein, partial [Bacillota bacterium]|nr:branched-chain amino acid ABC transporter substrate-binding protein [Bacillota bacterium]